MSIWPSFDALSDAIVRMQRHSPFLSRLIEVEPDIVSNPSAWLADPIAVASRIDADLPPARRLRRMRRRIALSVALGDLSGGFDLTRVTHLLSDFADFALDEALRIAIEERTPGETARGFAVIALGKQGSRELNYSSDVDPILVFDPATLPHRAKEAPEEAAVRIGRRMIELLQARDADGYVLRVDLRLRPSPEVTPIVLPINAAISYYESQALTWERAAFIRSRAAAGDRVLGERFLQQINPFIWRRALDFGTIAEIRQLTRRIRDHYGKGQRLGPGYDLKRGRGGIREAEFFAQVHQLIHGGRDPALRVPATRDALTVLARAGWIEAEAAEQLSAGYARLRQVEHRLQMIDDRQTHSLPASIEALDRVALLDGCADGEALIATIAPHVRSIGGWYDALDEGSAAEEGDALPEDDGPVQDWLIGIGFGEPDRAVARITAWRSGRYPALRSAAARTALEAALKPMILALSRSGDPDAAILRFDAVLAKLPSAINFFRLLEANPALATLLGDILCHAPTLADALGRRVELLDGLIDASALEPVASVTALIEEMVQAEPGEDYQGLLNRVRKLVNERRFALGAQIIAGVSDPLDVSRGYSRVAEAAVEVLTRATIAEFRVRHGQVPDSELMILALGRLGGGALTHASDLDLIFLFTGNHLAESDGAKALGAVHYYNRLAQRVTAALSVATAAGPLYEIDTRLRPSGAQGPIAVSLAGFALYQRESAWTWEHMALTRARAIFGSADARSAVEAVIASVLAGDRPARDIRTDAYAMRGEMAAHKPPLGPFDAKLLPGGLVDLEFAVHVTQLEARAGFAPNLPAAIKGLAVHGLIDPGMREAHDRLNRWLVTLRLVAPDATEPPIASQALVARAVGSDDWQTAVAQFAATRQDVTHQWAALAPLQGAMTMAIKEGDALPTGMLTMPDGTEKPLGDFAGNLLVLYFYPKDDTPGCTREAQDFSAAIDDFSAIGAVVLGISKDPPAKHRKFIDKYGLSVELASDEPGDVLEAFGAWVEKSMYGKTYMGIERSTFLFGADGKLVRAWRKVRVPGHVAEVLEAAKALTS